MVFFIFSVGLLMMMEVVDRVRRMSLEKINSEKGRMRLCEASDGSKHSHLDNCNAQRQYKAST